MQQDGGAPGHVLEAPGIREFDRRVPGAAVAPGRDAGHLRQVVAPGVFERQQEGAVLVHQHALHAVVTEGDTPQGDLLHHRFLPGYSFRCISITRYTVQMNVAESTANVRNPLITPSQLPMTAKSPPGMAMASPMCFAVWSCVITVPSFSSARYFSQQNNKNSHYPGHDPWRIFNAPMLASKGIHYAPSIEP